MEYGIVFSTYIIARRCISCLVSESGRQGRIAPGELSVLQPNKNSFACLFWKNRQVQATCFSLSFLITADVYVPHTVLNILMTNLMSQQPNQIDTYYHFYHPHFIDERNRAPLL